MGDGILISFLFIIGYILCIGMIEHGQIIQKLIDRNQLPFIDEDIRLTHVSQ